MAEPARIDEQGELARGVQTSLVLGNLGDFACELVDHPLIEINGFRPLLGTHVPCRIS